MLFEFQYFVLKFNSLTRRNMTYADLKCQILPGPHRRFWKVTRMTDAHTTKLAKLSSPHYAIFKSWGLCTFLFINKILNNWNPSLDLHRLLLSRFMLTGNIDQILSGWYDLNIKFLWKSELVLIWRPWPPCFVL